MLTYTGHPLYDVGVATITAFAGKSQPEDLTEEDLDNIAQYMAREYVRPPLQNFFTVAFPASGYNNPSFKNYPAQRKAYARAVLWGFSSAAHPTDVCVFTGKPAAHRVFKQKDDIPAGRAFRNHIPMLTGEGIINFFPYGDAGLPVSGEAMLALQAQPLGSAKSAGRMLAVHSDNLGITQYFARRFLMKNLELVGVAQQAGESKLPEPRLKTRTLLMQVLVDAQREAGRAVEVQQAYSVTAYHLTNSGQGADVAIYRLPSQVVAFLAEMNRPRYEIQWGQIVRLAWERPGRRDGDDFEPGRNYLYEDIFALPGQARRFVRTYLLRQAWRISKQNVRDPRSTYSLLSEGNLVSWAVTEQFLRRIMNVEEARIATIRELGDRLAEYIATENDRRFFRAFFTEGRYGVLRDDMIKANLRWVRHGNAPLLQLDPYLEVFEDSPELATPDWRLARDLVLIRMVEQLYERGWFATNTEVLASADEGGVIDESDMDDSDYATEGEG